MHSLLSVRLVAGAALHLQEAQRQQESIKQHSHYKSTLDTINFLAPDEAFNLVSMTKTVRDEIAAGIYYKDIGSRKNLTVAESDVEYAGSSDNVKTVYTNKAITDIRKLVTEGYIKIERQSLDVEIATREGNIIMAEFYTNLPPKTKMTSDKTVEKLTTPTMKQIINSM